jgi:hypothetical protein
MRHGHVDGHLSQPYSTNGLATNNDFPGNFTGCPGTMERLIPYPRAQEFLQAIRPLLPAYRHALFSYAEIMSGGENIIIRARMELRVEKPSSWLPPVRTRSLSVAQCHGMIGPGAVELFIEAALSGAHMPLLNDKVLKLLPRTDAASPGYSAYYELSRASPIQPSSDIDRLVLSGIDRHQLIGVRAHEIELEVRAYGSLDNLLRLYGLNAGSETAFEVTAGQVATIHASSSITRRTLHIDFSLANGLSIEPFQLCAVNADPNILTPPRVAEGVDLTWKDRQDRKEAQWNVELANNEVLDCHALYAGRLQSTVRLADTQALPNRRRMLLGLIDTDLSHLTSILTDPARKQLDDFEPAVALLLQLLGFESLYIGRISRWKDEPDILATSPMGDLVMVEATTRIPDESKLTLFATRVARMREDLQRAQPGTAPKVIALFITLRPPQELVAIRQTAERHEVILLGRPDLEEAIARTQFAPNPAAVLKHWQDLPLMRYLTGSPAERMLRS